MSANVCLFRAGFPAGARSAGSAGGGRTQPRPAGQCRPANHIPRNHVGLPRTGAACHRGLPGTGRHIFGTGCAPAPRARPRTARRRGPDIAVVDGTGLHEERRGLHGPDDAAAGLRKQIEGKQKSFDRSVQDAREDAQGQQGEIMQRILQKMVPVIQSYVAQNGYGLLLDTSQPWPQGPVVMAGPSFDITQAVVDAYNVKSGVPAPPPASAGATRPAGTAPRPVTAPAKPAPKPATSTPPKQ